MVQIFVFQRYSLEHYFNFQLSFFGKLSIYRNKFKWKNRSFPLLNDTLYWQIKFNLLKYHLLKILQ